MRRIILLGLLGVVAALFWVARPAVATDTTITEISGVWSESQTSTSDWDWIAEMTEFDCPATDRPFVEIQLEIVSPYGERFITGVIDLQCSLIAR